MLVLPSSTTWTSDTAGGFNNVGDNVWQCARTLLDRLMALWRLAIARGSGRCEAGVTARRLFSRRSGATERTTATWPIRILAFRASVGRQLPGPRRLPESSGVERSRRVEMSWICCLDLDCAASASKAAGLHSVFLRPPFPPKSTLSARVSFHTRCTGCWGRHGRSPGCLQAARLSILCPAAFGFLVSIPAAPTLTPQTEAARIACFFLAPNLIQGLRHLATPIF